MKQFTAITDQYSSEEYYEKMKTWAEQGQTSGKEQSDSRIAFTALNHKRIQRILKTFRVAPKLEELLSSLGGDQYWFVFTESWCGDSAQISPILTKFAAASNGKIHLRFLFRDEHPQLMQKYLTNGGLSIPKLVAFDEQGLELFQFGPRPASAQKILLDWKQDSGGRTHDDFEKELHTFYAKDRGKSIEAEFQQLLG